MIPEVTFASPPVTEVAAGVQFAPLAGLHVHHIGLLWEKFRDRFPVVEEHPTLDPVFEKFGERKPLVPSINVKLVTETALPRCWFLTKDGSELIQLQADRFFHNWRRQGEGQAYPTYAVVRDSLRRELSIFEDFILENELDKLTPNQCELTYVNQIVSGSAWHSHADLERLVTVWKSPELSNIEEVRFVIRRLIIDEGGQPIGRLHVDMQPVYRIPDDKPAFILKIIARGKPLGDDLDGVFRFLDRGHKEALETFTAISSKTLQTDWS